MYYHRIIIVLFALSQSFSLRAQTPGCDLGNKIRSLSAIPNETVLRELILDPLFIRDDEKYVDALIKLKASDKIEAYINKGNEKRLSNAARERRALGLRKLASYSRDHVNRLLYVDLAETSVARGMEVPALSETEWLARMEVLSEHNDNGAVIAQIEARKDMSPSMKCRTLFLLGKAYRKNRNYAQAQEVLEKVAKGCHGAEEVDASFLLARLAAIVPTEENMKYFADFRRKHPSHSYLDDVLLFKASALETLGRREEAKKTLLEIWKLKQIADMRFEAIFRLAFMYATEGKTSEAITVLQTSLREAYEPNPNPTELQRAEYWIARLHLYPDVSTLRKRSAKSEAVAIQMLEKLAKNTLPTYYSFLASEILSLEKGAQISAFAKPSVSKPNEAEIKDPNFRRLFCMLSTGFADEATHFIQLIESDEVLAGERLEIARRLNELGLYADAFRFASNTNDNDRYLLYPQAYQAQVEEAATQVGPSVLLLYSLMREESRFDPSVISWAGALGVLQLMPAVAKEEGRRFKFGELTKEKMLDPKVNIMLGAQHLKGMLDDVKHPLFAVAAYNAGLDRVKRWEERFRKFETIDTFIENIPLPETRAYVKRVAGSWVNYAQLYASDAKPFRLGIASK